MGEVIQLFPQEPEVVCLFCGGEGDPDCVKYLRSQGYKDVKDTQCCECYELDRDDSA